MPVDVRLAFLAELAEPLVEIMKKEGRMPASLATQGNQPPLRMYLDSLLKVNGTIF